MELSLICLINLLKNNIKKNIYNNKKTINEKYVFSDLDFVFNFSALNKNDHKNNFIKIENTKKNNLIFLKNLIELIKLVYEFIIQSVVYIIYDIIYKFIIQHIYEIIIQYLKYIILYIIYNDISLNNFFFGFINNSKKFSDLLLEIENTTRFYNENDENFNLRFN